MNKDNATNIGKFEITSIEWYVPHCTPLILHQAILSRKISSKVPTDLQHIKRSVLKREIFTRSAWTFELGTHEGINNPIWINVGTQQRDRRDSQSLSKDTFLHIQ